MRDWTPLIVFAIPFVLGGLDVLLYWYGGNEATISVAMLRARMHNPLVAIGTAYTGGVFIGHVFYVKFSLISPPTYEVLARMCVVLSPMLYALIVIAANNGANETHRQWVEANGHWRLMLTLNVAFVIGQFAGMYILCQHVAPLGTTGG